MAGTIMLRRRALCGALLACGAMGATGARAQIWPTDLFGKGLRLLKDLTIKRWLQEEPPVSTRLADAVWGNPQLDGLTPELPLRRLTALERTERGGFILQPGYWRFSAQSYCLHAGSALAGGGEGYLYAPLKGAAKEPIRDILRNSFRNPDIPATRIQSLIWAILARSRFEDLNPELRAVGIRLLSGEQLARLNRSAMDLVPTSALHAILPEIPSPLRMAFETEASLRRALTVGGADYAQLAAIAVPGGLAPPGPGSLEVPSGRWSEHPDGYRVRYKPSGYSRTDGEIWVDPDSAAVGQEYDPAGHVVVPGNTFAQRLGISGRQSPVSAECNEERIRAGYEFLDRITKSVNPRNCEFNCYEILGAAALRLTGDDTLATAPPIPTELDIGTVYRSFGIEDLDQISKVSFSQAFSEIGKENGRIGLLYMHRNNKLGHVVLIANADGAVAIIEGQDTLGAVREAQAPKVYENVDGMTLGLLPHARVRMPGTERKGPCR